MEEIKTSTFNINDEIKFDNDFNIEYKSINFIYANNGVGKTQLAKYLLNYEKFIELENNTYINNQNSNCQILVSKNINKIKKLQSMNAEIKEKLRSEIFKYFSKEELANGGNIYKYAYKLYFNDNPNFNFIDKFFKPKNKKRYEYINEITDQEIVDMHKKLMEFKYEEYEKEVNLSQINNKFNINSTFKNINNICKKIIDKQIKIISEEENIDYNILQNIYESIKNLNQMENCYICGNKILNFAEIKNKINEKLKNKQFEECLTLKQEIKEWDKILNSNLLDYFNNDKFCELITKLNKDFENYNNYLSKIIFDLKEIFQNQLINQFIDNLEKIANLENEKEIKNKELKKEDIQFCKNLISYIIKEQQIKWDLDNNIISIDMDDENNFKLSSGEVKIICLIINLLFFINEDDYKNKFLILDDICDGTDKLNRTNIEHIIKMYFYEYKVKFLIFTHDYKIIREIQNSRFKSINLYLMYKDIYNVRCFKKITIGENDTFFTFKEGRKIIYQNIKSKLLDNESNPWNSDNVLLFLYFCYLLRIKEYIWCENNVKKYKVDNVYLYLNQMINDNEKSDDYTENDNQCFFNILKFSFLYTDKEINKKIFKDVINKIKKEFSIKTINNELTNYNNFRKILSEIIKNINNIKLSNSLDISNPKFQIVYSEYSIVFNNINILLKLMFIREKIRFFIVNKLIELEYKNKDVLDDNSIKWWNALNILEKENKINNLQRKTLAYSLNLLNNFFHIEHEPSFIFDGLQFNEEFLTKFINDIEAILQMN